MRQAQWGRTGRYESKTSFSPRGLSQIRLGRSREANHIASRSGMDPPRVTGPNLVAGRAGSNVRVPDSKQLRKLRAFQVRSFLPQLPGESDVGGPFFILSSTSIPLHFTVSPLTYHLPDPPTHCNALLSLPTTSPASPRLAPLQHGSSRPSGE